MRALIEAVVAWLRGQGVDVRLSGMYGTGRAPYVCLHLVNVSVDDFEELNDERSN